MELWKHAAPSHVVVLAVDVPLSPVEFRKYAAPSHAVAPAVDVPLSAVQNAPHVCLYLFASPGYSAVPSLLLTLTPSVLSSGVMSLRTFASFVLT